MSIVEMNIQEALSKKKSIEKKLSRKKKQPFVGYVIDGKYENMKEKDYASKLMGNFQSTMALIHNLSVLRSAINQHNATTIIVVAGKEYTKTEAITRYQSIDDELIFISRLEKQLKNINATIRYNNESKLSDKSIEKYKKQMEGWAAIDEDAAKVIIKSYKKQNTMKLVDPCNIQSQIEIWKQDIEDFKDQIHDVLIESNVKSTIRLEFED